MLKIVIKPLVGIEWNGQLVSLKCTREAVEQVFGKPDVWENSCYYFENELRFDFNDSGELEFIEFLGGAEGQLQPELFGVKPFQMQADALYRMLAEHNAGEIDDSENGYSYAFLESSMGVYRDTIPEDVLEMIEEAKADGEPLSQEEIDEEMYKANHWATIGLGVEGYYRNC